MGGQPINQLYRPHTSHSANQLSGPINQFESQQTNRYTEKPIKKSVTWEVSQSIIEAANNQ
jgi:hypothetical protein